jgi:hypothetical protein
MIVIVNDSSYSPMGARLLYIVSQRLTPPCYTAPDVEVQCIVASIFHSRTAAARFDVFIMLAAWPNAERCTKMTDGAEQAISYYIRDVASDPHVQHHTQQAPVVP